MFKGRKCRVSGKNVLLLLNEKSRKLDFTEILKSKCCGCLKPQTAGKDKKSINGTKILKSITTTWKNTQKWDIVSAKN